MLDKVRRNVSFNMMYAHQRFPRRVSNGLRLCHAHKQGSHQTWAVGDCHRVRLRQENPRCAQRFLDHLVDPLNMFPGSDLRHNAAIEGVEIDLGRDHVGENFSSISDHRRRSLVTGTLNCQDQCIFHLLFLPAQSVKTSSIVRPSFAATVRGKIARTSSIYSSGFVRDGL